MDGRLVVRGIIPAEKHEVGAETVDPGNEAVQIPVGKPEAVMNIAEIDNAEIIGVIGQVLGLQLDLLGAQQAGLQQRIPQQHHHEDQHQDQPPAVMAAADLMAAAAGGGRLPRSGRDMLSPIGVHVSLPPFPRLTAQSIYYTLNPRIFKKEMNERD